MTEQTKKLFEDLLSQVTLNGADPDLTMKANLITQARKELAEIKITTNK